MKKLIAILTIAIVLVGAAFADVPNTGTANVKVVTLIKVIEPEFKLTTNASDSGALVADSSVATMDPAAEADTVANDRYHVIDVNTMSATEGETTVTFFVKQTNSCKSYKTYTFEATATDLIMVKAYNNAGELVAYDYANATDANKLHRHFAVDNSVVATFSSTGADAKFTALVDQTNSSATAYKITYTGDQVTEGTVASFTCAWTRDLQAVPGQYEADIRLTVTAE